MSEEKVLTLRGKKAVWAPGGGSGPIDPKRLPEGYPYKEMGKTEFAILGEVEFTYHDGISVQATASVNEKIVVGETYAVVLDGKEYVATAFEFTQYGMSITMLGNAMHIDGSFDENGPPFAFTTVEFGGQVRISMSITAEAGVHTVEVYKFSEIIHTMAPEFLPAGVGGGVQVVTFATDDMQTFTADKTFDEIAELSKNNIPVMGKIVFNGMSGMDIWLQISTAVNMNSNADTIGFYNVGAGAGGKVSIVQVAMTKTDIVYTQAEGTLTPPES